MSLGDFEVMLQDLMALLERIAQSLERLVNEPEARTGR